MADWEVYPRVAAAVARAAHDEGLARAWPGDDAAVLAMARGRIAGSRSLLGALVASGSIPPWPDAG